MGSRQNVEGVRSQGPAERIAYTITTTPWASTPSGVVVTLLDTTLPYSVTDVSSTKLSGSPSVLGDVITTPHVVSLVDGRQYRLDCLFVAGGNTYVAYVNLECE